MSAKRKLNGEITFSINDEEIAQLKNSKGLDSGEDLAERSDRLFANLIDLSPIILGVILAGLFTNYRNLIVAIFKVLAHAIGLLNMFLLCSRGQTIGKYFRAIRIVELKTGKILDWTRTLFLRPLPFLILYVFFSVAVASREPQYSLIPLLFALIDVLFIFRKDRRCLHDLIAGSKVISRPNAESLIDALKKSILE